jgi:hypothetical protein
VFEPADRERAKEHLLRAAEGDPRVVAAAFIGSSAVGEDRWSDLDLTLGVDDEASIDAVLADWTRDLSGALGGTALFDLQAGSSLYRVFLLPGCLQVDVSFTPARDFGATGPRFSLLFGESIERPHSPEPDAADLFGRAVHHAVRTRICVERGRLWQAEYWLGSLRNDALALACVRRDLPASHGRGLHELPADVTAAFEQTLIQSLEPEELLRVLRVGVEALLREGNELAPPLERELRAL